MWVFENLSNRGKGGSVITKNKSEERLGDLAHESLRGWYIRAERNGDGWLYYNSSNELVGKFYEEGIASEPTSETKFVILQGIAERNRFFSTHCPEQDQTKLEDGTVAYRILGYAETVEQAQIFLYGRSYTK